MTELKQSLEKIKAASKLMQQHKQSDLTIETNMLSLRQTLYDINESVETLKNNINDTKNSPIRFNK